MRRLKIILFATLMTSCMQEERELLDDLILKTSSQNIELFYTTQTIPRTKRMIDFIIDGSTRVTNERDAEYIAGRSAIVAFEKLDKNKLSETECIRVKFTNPDFPNFSEIDSYNYYDFDIIDLRKAYGFINKSEDIIQSYYFGDDISGKAPKHSTDENRIDTLLSRILPKGDLKKLIFEQFVTITDSLNNKYTCVLYSVSTKTSNKGVTIVFDNKTKRIIEVN